MGKVAQKIKGKKVRKQDVEGLLLHLVRGAKKHGSIDETYLRDIMTRHNLEMTFADLVNE